MLLIKRRTNAEECVQSMSNGRNQSRRGLGYRKIHGCFRERHTKKTLGPQGREYLKGLVCSFEAFSGQSYDRIGKGMIIGG